jgi:hypothetical protein
VTVSKDGIKLGNHHHQLPHDLSSIQIREKMVNQVALD